MREKLRKIIFEADTKSGKLYDVILILTVFISVFAVMIDSVSSFHQNYGIFLYRLEWFFTAIFTLDYIIRLMVVLNPFNYAKSFFGLVDLLGVIPTYLGLFLPGARYLIAIRYLRILRIFRVLKLVSYLEEARSLSNALKSSLKKIAVFLFTVLTIVVVLGSLMYVIEGEINGFTSIPKSIYWAIVTLTTVGYGDISPQTPLGQALAAVIMILGYSIIVIPTGIVTVDMATSKLSNSCDVQYCEHCGKELS